LSERSPAPSHAPPDARGFFAGAALAGLVFVAVHRLDLALGGAAATGAFVVAVLLAAWWAGAELAGLLRTPSARTRTRVAGALVLVGVASAMGCGPLACTPTRVLVASGVLALLISLLISCSHCAGRPLVGGAAVGFAALSAGLAAAVGVLWLSFGAAIVLAACALWPSHATEGPKSGAGAPADAPEGASDASKLAHGSSPDPISVREEAPAVLLLCAMGGLLCVAMLRTYSPVTGWHALAVSDLCVAACIGALIARGFVRGEGVVARVLVLAGVAALLESSLFMYPDLILSESAALQSARTLLEGARAFPVWAFAALLGACWTRAGARGGARWMLAAAAGAAVALVIPPSFSHVWHYAAALALGALALVSEGARVRAEEGARLRAIHVVALVVVTAALGWSVLGAPALKWRVLRQRFAWYRADVPGRLNPASLPEGAARPDLNPAIEELTFHPWGLSARLSAGGEWARLECGNVVASSRALDSRSVRLCVALAVAGADRVERIALIDPALDVTSAGVHALAPGAQLVRIPAAALINAPDDLAPLDAVICGPGPLTRARCPLAIVNVETLAHLRFSLREGGVLVLWLPTRTLSAEQLRRTITTALAAFPRARLFIAGDELVLLCGGGERLAYTRLLRLFDDPAALTYLTAGGLWDARQVLAMFTAEFARDASAQPFSLRRPTRAPVLARDLSSDSRAGTLASVAQHRLLPASRAADAFAFGGEMQRAVALASFHRLYAAQTESVLRGVGEAGRTRTAELIAALSGPCVDLERFAPEPQNKRVKCAVALHRFGLYAESLQLLQGRAWTGADAFHANYWIGRDLHAMGRLQHALGAYEAALRERPEDADLLVRIARVRFNLNQPDEAMKLLERALAADENNVEALVFLSYLHGRAGNRAKAAALAGRALKIDPSDETARDLYSLYGRSGEPLP